MSAERGLENIYRTFGVKMLAKQMAPSSVWSFFRSARIIVESIGGFPKIIDTSLGSISASFHVGGPIEQRQVRSLGNERKFLADIVATANPYSSAAFVGANIGIHSIYLAKAAPLGTVIAIEPDPVCAKRIRQNIELNNLKNTKVVECAVTDQNNLVTLKTSKKGLEGPVSALQMHSNGEHESSVEIAGCTLDHLLQKFPTIDILVVDAEGHENPIFQGMTIIKPTHIFVEVHPTLGGSLEETLKLLGTKGYLCVRKYLRGGQILAHFAFTGQ